MRTWRLPAFSALLMAFSASLRTLVLTILAIYELLGTEILRSTEELEMRYLCISITENDLYYETMSRFPQRATGNNSVVHHNKSRVSLQQSFRAQRVPLLHLTSIGDQGEKGFLSPCR